MSGRLPGQGCFCENVRGCPRLHTLRAGPADKQGGCESVLCVWARGLAKWPGAGSWEFQVVNSEITKVLVEEGGPGLIFPHHWGWKERARDKGINQSGQVTTCQWEEASDEDPVSKRREVERMGKRGRRVLGSYLDSKYHGFCISHSFDVKCMVD